MTSDAIPICHAHKTSLNWPELATAIKVDTDVMHPVPGWKFPLLLLMLFIDK